MADGAPSSCGASNDGGSDAAARLPCGDTSCLDPAARLARLLDDWPVLEPGWEARSFSSFDRTGGNDDGFAGTYSALYVEANGENVLFDAEGPGILDTLWFTGPDEGGAGFDAGVVRFYLDGEDAPRVEISSSALFSGAQPPFLSPLVTDNSVSTGAFVSWVPVPFAAHLKVTTTRRPSFYQAHYEVLPADASVASFDPNQDVEKLRAAFESSAEPTAPAGAVTVPLETTLDGPATVDFLEFTAQAPPTDDALAKARIQITWDGMPQPLVDAPLAAFFGSGLGVADVSSLPLSIHGRTFTSRFRMPYLHEAAIRIVGIDGRLRVHARPDSGLGDAAYFAATYSEAQPTTPGQDFEWLGVSGSGRLVGTTLTVRPAASSVKKWWEGDLRSYADGRRTPGISGTGHEDDNLAGWSNTLFSRPFTLPMAGVPRSDVIDRTGQYNANVSFYRFYPGVPFHSGVRHSTEHGSRNGVQATYSGVAYYYLQSSGSELSLADRVVLGDESSRSAHAYTGEGTEARPVTSAFEGRDDAERSTLLFVDVTGASSFRATIPAANAGCVLRRVSDQSSGRQAALVRIDGRPVGRWYVAEGNASFRFSERDYFLPPAYTAGKASILVGIDAEDGAPPWATAEYAVYCYR